MFYKKLMCKYSVGWKRDLGRAGKLAEVTDERSRAFDIAYAEERAYMIKVMYNIESLNQEKAEVLKKCAAVAGAEPVVISSRGKELLKEDVVYKRFGIPVMRGETFASMIHGENVSVADRGGIKVPITGLREAREKTGMTRATLAKLLGVSTEMVRKYELERAEPGEKVAMRLVEIFGHKIIGKPSFKGEKITKAFIGKAPFDMAIRKDKTMLISFKSSPERVKNLEGVSDVLDAEPVIAKRLEDIDI